MSESDYNRMYHLLYYATAGAARRNAEAAKLLREALDECNKIYLESLRISEFATIQPNEEAADQ